MSKYDVLASADGEGTDANRHDAVFVHCCESGSLLSRPMSGACVTMVDIIAEADFTDDRTVRSVNRYIRTAVDVFFYCSPCTG
ncbi:MAG: hypothetical protein ACKPKO_22435, partial [Candidatus Fonsibacter sp.]